MRQHKATLINTRIDKSTAKKNAIAKYKRQAKSKRIGKSSQVKLMYEIRMGDRDAILKLVDSWEYIIVIIIEQLTHSSPASSNLIEKLFIESRKTLIRLAETELDKVAFTTSAAELGRTSRALFFDFGIWQVKQMVLQLLAEQKQIELSLPRFIDWKTNILTDQQKAVIFKYKQETERKKPNPSLEAALLRDIRKGDSEAIPKLVNSWAYMTISVIERTQINNGSVSIEKLFNSCKQALIRLAEQELGSAGSERFFVEGELNMQAVVCNELAVSVGK